MEPHEVKRYWDGHFPECPPISHVLKEALKERWFRIHSLPLSKRYAENDAEKREILTRYNSVLGAVLDEGEEVLVICEQYDGDDSADGCAALQQLNLREFTEIEPGEGNDDEDAPVLRLSYAHEPLQIGRLNAVFQCVADELIRAFVVSLASNRIFAPYDGGADIVLESELVRDRFREQFAEWSSAHPDGL